MAVTLLQATMQESILIATSNYCLKIFHSRDEWFLCLGWEAWSCLMRYTSLRPHGFCHSLNQHAAGRANQALVGIHQDQPLSITPVLSPMGGLHEPWQCCPRECPEPRQQQLSALSVLCSSGWQNKQCPQDEGSSRPCFAVSSLDWCKPNGIQQQCCQSSLKWLLCHVEVRWPFYSPFHSRIVWIIQLLSGTFRQVDWIVMMLPWVYLQIRFHLIWWKQLCNNSKNWFLIFSLILEWQRKHLKCCKIFQLLFPWEYD